MSTANSEWRIAKRRKHTSLFAIRSSLFACFSSLFALLPAAPAGAQFIERKELSYAAAKAVAEAALVPRTRRSHYCCRESECERRVQSGTRIMIG